MGRSAKIRSRRRRRGALSGHRQSELALRQQRLNEVLEEQRKITAALGTFNRSQS